MRIIFNYNCFLFLQSAIGKEGIYLEDHDHVDRFSYRSNDPNNYSPSFYHFRPSKTSISRPGAGGSIRKESRPGSPFYKAGNSYTGRYLITKQNLGIFLNFMTSIIRMASKYRPFFKSKLNAPISQGFIDL